MSAEAEKTHRVQAAKPVVLAVVASIGANLVIYGIARWSGADLLVPESPGSDKTELLEPAPVVASSTVPVLVASVFALGLGRWAAARGRTIFTTVILLVLGASFILFVTHDFSAGTNLALATMHLTPAVTAIVFLRPLAGPESKARMTPDTDDNQRPST